MPRATSGITVRIIGSRERAPIAALLDRGARRDAGLDRRVARIVSRVRREGDRALLAYARQFDRLTQPMEVTADEIRAAAREVPRDVREAIAAAARHIRRVAARQVPVTNPT